MTVNITALWDALGWAILHSLWQGALIALIVCGIRALVTERRARLRYLLGMFGLVATFGAFLATFMILTVQRLRDGVGSRLGEGLGGVSGSQAGSLPMVDAETLEPTLSISVLPSASIDAGMAQALVPWLGMIWAIGFAFLGLQSYRAWARTRWLATTGLRTPGPDWTQRFAALAMRSRTHERVRLFVSEHVTGPLTLGALRPIVLVPIGFLTSMPPEQVEAILLHELAHIRRHDFMFGLIQTAIRTVLYYNPAVLILSKLVDTDREQACDDIAVSVTGRPVDLVRGLAALRLGRQASHAPNLVMAADGGPLLARLNRLMGRPAARGSSSRLAAVAVSATMLGTAAYSTVSVAHSQPPEAKAERSELPDTVVSTTDETLGKVYIQPPKVYIRPPDMPEMPAMPEMPVMPELPVMPVVEFGDYENSEAFEAAMEDWAERMESWGETIEDRFEGDWESQMEAWGEEMEVWGESLEAMGRHIDTLSEEELAEMGLDADWFGDASAAFGLAIADGVVRLLPDGMSAEAQAEIADARREVAKARAQAAKESAKRAVQNAQSSAERNEKRNAERLARNEARNEARNRAQAEASRMRAEAKARIDHARRTEGTAKSGVTINGNDIDVSHVRETLETALRSDGLIGDAYDTVELVLRDDETLRVDGLSQTKDRAKRYRDLLADHGINRDADVDIKLMRSRVAIKVESDGSTLQIDVKG